MSSAAKTVEPTQTSWVPPTADSEFVFSDMASVPAWVDPGWQSNGNYGPALAVPAFVFAEDGDKLDRSQAYHTNIANPGDTVKWIQAEHRFVIERAVGEPLVASGAYAGLENPYARTPAARASTGEPGTYDVGALQNTPPVEDVDLEDEDDDDTKAPAKKKGKK